MYRRTGAKRDCTAGTQGPLARRPGSLADQNRRALNSTLGAVPSGRFVVPTVPQERTPMRLLDTRLGPSADHRRAQVRHPKYQERQLETGLRPLRFWSARRSLQGFAMHQIGAVGLCRPEWQHSAATVRGQGSRDERGRPLV